ncbi:hypothetical protein ASPZODRAFT_19962 [Penicilliopsis zonata CBS 506.65]|uniref:Thioesterase domain-containing protein n=1 Tax=Penicilliopsis zonata CBS 506.65 TaxID=1073090 RepID=A0A1L9S754_9EURO|nr:hypothetical protein ASPZODRAFT_19962 [Penicilliopsis zonata CBS 506.65]OJJ42984.1 hypothetical protein ASPZODRAFT_19962 [Penicilliopsis zonata CBS 506.65]
MIVKHPITSPLLSHPDYTPIETTSRQRLPTDENGFFAGTLATATTIPHVQTLTYNKLVPLASSGVELEVESAWRTPLEPPDILMLLSLATPGLSGHPGLAHGGLLATVIDEAMSLALEAHSQIVSSFFTAQLDVRYLAPVPVPSVAVVRAKVVSRAGRKNTVRAEILDNGRICVEALGVWIEKRQTHKI